MEVGTDGIFVKYRLLRYNRIVDEIAKEIGEISVDRIDRETVCIFDKDQRIVDSTVERYQLIIDQRYLSRDIFGCFRFSDLQH